MEAALREQEAMLEEQTKIEWAKAERKAAEEAERRQRRALDAALQEKAAECAAALASALGTGPLLRALREHARPETPAQVWETHAKEVCA